MFAQVIPSLKLPRSTAHFDFLVPPELTEKLRLGSLVSLPWRGRAVEGLVIGLSEQTTISEHRLKSLLGLAHDLPIPAGLCQVILRLAEQRLISPATVLHACLPPPPKRPVSAVQTSAVVPPHVQPTTTVRRYATPQERQTICETAVAAELSAGRSVIIIAPHQVDVRRLVTAGHRLGWPMVELHGEIAPGKLRRHWLSCLSGEPCVVIGTRLAVFAPLPHLGLIIIQEADSPDLKQFDQNPRYDAREIGEWRTGTDSCSLLLLASSPRAEELKLTESGAVFIDAAAIPAPIVLVNASGPGISGDDRLITPAATTRTVEALQTGKKALYFHNRRGTATAVVCADCRLVLRCPDCAVALAESDERLRCVRCGEASDWPTDCADCHGHSFKAIGFGTVALERALQKRFPTARISRLDRDNAEFSAELNLDGDILIGTQLLLHELTENERGLRDIGAVIVTEAEALIGRHGFRSTEETRRLVTRLADLAAEAGTDLVLQCADADRPVVRDLAITWPEAGRSELSQRRLSGYPPFGTVGIITISSQTEAEAQTAAAAVKRQLEKVADATVRIFPPARPARPLRHGRWRRIIAFKGDADLPPSFRQALRQLPDEYIIDFNPESLD